MIFDQIKEQLSKTLCRKNDDLIDKLHYRFTVTALVVYTIMISTKQYFGEPIVCLTPKEATSDHGNFFRSQCWMNGTHTFDPNKNLNQQRDAPKIVYYQWIILILVAQSILFSLPSLIWTTITRLNGFDLVFITRNVIQKAYIDYSSDNSWPKMQKMLQNVTDHLRLSIIGDENIAKGAKIKKYLNFKTSFFFFSQYIAIKILYLLNIIFQFIILNIIFNFKYSQKIFTHAFSVLTRKEYYDYQNDLFPKQSVCHACILNLDGKQCHSFLCSLPINLYNEMFYSLFMIWILFLFLITFASMIYWLLLLYRPYRKGFVLSMINLQYAIDNSPTTDLAPVYMGEAGKTKNDEEKLLIQNTGKTLSENFNEFFKNVCSYDLILTIKLISFNTNPLVARDLLRTIWYEFLDINTSEKANKLSRRPLPPFRRTKFEFKSLNENTNEEMLNDDN